jgi:peptidoglycan/LPS O-acetylase OafA/YrhL
MREPDRIGALDSVRGVAALIVVVHHCLLTQPAFSDYFFSRWRTGHSSLTEWLMFETPLRLLWNGAEAVTLFYVLSGLVLSLPWFAGRPPRYRDYAIRRLCRLYLPYAAAVGLSAVLAVWLHPVAAVPGLSDWVNTMNWTKEVTPAVLIDHAVMLGHRNILDGVVHTLIWEVRVSLVFPLLILPIVWWGARGAVGTAVAIWAVVLGTHFAYNRGVPPVDLLQWREGFSRLGMIAMEVQGTAYYATFFVIGSTIAFYLADIKRIRGSAAMALLVAGLLVFQGHWSRDLFTQDLVVAAGSAMIVVAALAGGPFQRILQWAPLLWLGKVSYSLYLVHVPLLLVAVILLHDTVPAAAILVCVPFASLAAAWLFNDFVAEPSARLGRSLTGRGRARAETALLNATGTAATTAQPQ